MVIVFQPKCPDCNSNNIGEIGSFVYYDYFFLEFECRNCGKRFQKEENELIK